LELNGINGFPVKYRLPDQNKCTPKQVITETGTYSAIETQKDLELNGINGLPRGL
jgi:hypothetical protein